MQAVPGGFAATQLSRKEIAVLAGVVPQAGADVDASGVERMSDDGFRLMRDASELLASLRRQSEVVATSGRLGPQYKRFVNELQALSEQSSEMLELMSAVKTEKAGQSMEEVVSTVLPERVLDCLGRLSQLAGRAVTFFCSPSAYMPVAIEPAMFEELLTGLVELAAKDARLSERVAVTLVGMREPGRGAEGIELVLTVRGRARGMALGDQWPGVQALRDLAAEGGGVLEAKQETDGGLRVSVSWPTMHLRSIVRSTNQGADAGRDIQMKAEALLAKRLPERVRVVPEELIAGGEAC